MLEPDECFWSEAPEEMQCSSEDCDHIIKKGERMYSYEYEPFCEKHGNKIEGNAELRADKEYERQKETYE
jgi:hypothetical protein